MLFVAEPTRKTVYKKELQRTAAGAHDQIGLTDGIGKAFAGAESHLLNANEQCHTEGDRPQRRRYEESSPPEHCPPRLTWIQPLNIYSSP
jgi:hypothetical protein